MEDDLSPDTGPYVLVRPDLMDGGSLVLLWRCDKTKHLRQDERCRPSGGALSLCTLSCAERVVCQRLLIEVNLLSLSLATHHIESDGCG